MGEECTWGESGAMTNLIFIICEGQSENQFIKSILCPWFYEKTDKQCQLMPYTVITSTDRRAGRVYRGGIRTYAKVRNDLLRCMSYGYPVSTMIDLFRLPSDFPGQDEAGSITDGIRRVELLERKMKEDLLSRLPSYRPDFLLPYISLHEFETLFFCDLNVLKYEYVERSEQDSIDQLISKVSGMGPEDINQGPETAPSKRLMNALKYEKGSAVVYPLQEIGVDQMMQKCPHFRGWVERMLAVLGDPDPRNAI